ncbi:MAG TPA: HD domain-containing protein [Pyrodictium sp.]|nr:HD domain-containing protein [Pyrodictium sp.]
MVESRSRTSANVVKVSKDLVFKHLEKNSFLKKAYEELINDAEVKALLHMSNVMAVKRLKYNDHGPVHANIVAGVALELLERLLQHDVVPNSIKDGVVDNLDYVRLIVLYGALLHDIGNAVHRDMHERIGALLAKDILDRILSRLIKDRSLAYLIRQEILHAIYATAYDVRCLSVEAGIVKIADGLDMAEGRARIPYKLGKMDIHALSALSIKSVEIGEGVKRPIAIRVFMNDSSGVFQVEYVFLPKLRTSGLEHYFEVYIATPLGEHRLYP